MGKRKSKEIKYEKFLVCPNCKYPMYRKKALRTIGLEPSFCKGCGIDLTGILKNAKQVMMNQSYDYEIQADDCTELTDTDKEKLEKLNYFISNDDDLKEISIIPCNEKKIVLHSMMEVERFIEIIKNHSRLVFDT